jgi:hypothetical protein
MRIAITFRDQAEYKSRGNERGHTCLSSGEAESLPQFIEFETPSLANHKYLCGVYSCAAAPKSCAAAREFSGGSRF